MSRVFIGTSGWHYDSWKGPFFPDGLMGKHQLLYYASQFCTAELNGVFYRTPTPEAVSSWYEQTGNNFIFLESLEIHNSLEATDRSMSKQPRAA